MATVSPPWLFQPPHLIPLFPQDLKAQITQASDTAEEFTRLFYESLDKRRHVSLHHRPETA